MWSTKQCPCPFTGCPGSSQMWNGLGLHFSSQHRGDRSRILEEYLNPLSRCERCGSQVPEGRLNTCHYTSEKCKQGEESRLIRETLQLCFETSKVSFQINAETLPPLEDFPYLGWTITYNNSNWAAVYQNLRKYRMWWGMVARVLEL